MASGAPSVGLAIRGPLGKHSTSIVTGNRSQKLLDASSNWNYIFIQNPSTATESLYVDYGIDAAIDDTCEEILPGSYLFFRTPGFITTQQINIIAATAGHKFICYAA